MEKFVSWTEKRLQQRVRRVWWSVKKAKWSKVCKSTPKSFCFFSANYHRNNNIGMQENFPIHNTQYFWKMLANKKVPVCGIMSKIEIYVQSTK